jgi:hypothetical protein
MTMSRSRNTPRAALVLAAVTALGVGASLHAQQGQNRPQSGGEATIETIPVQRECVHARGGLTTIKAERQLGQA